MLNGEGKAGERWKTTIGLISKKATLHVQLTFFVPFFAVVLHDYNVKLPKTFLWRKFRTCSRSLLFSLPLIFFLHWWPLAFLILSPLLQNFHVVLPTKKFLLCFLSLALDLCRPFSRWVSLAYRFFSVFLLLYSPNFLDMKINPSLILLENADTAETISTSSAFRFRLYWLFSWLCFTRHGWPCDFPPK